MMTRFRRSISIASALAGSLLSLGGCEPAKQDKPVPTSAAALAKLKPVAPKPVPPVTFIGADGKAHGLNEFRGRYVLLNLWATWCAPCVRELPALSHLQANIDSTHLTVVPVNVGRGTASDTETFLKEHVAALPVYLDTKSAFLHAFGAYGLPLTVLIDPKGREIARASGAVQWDAQDSVAYFKQLHGSQY